MLFPVLLYATVVEQNTKTLQKIRGPGLWGKICRFYDYRLMDVKCSTSYISYRQNYLCHDQQ